MRLTEADRQSVPQKKVHWKTGHEVEQIKRKKTKLEHKKSVNTTFSTVNERNAFAEKKTNRHGEL